MNGCTQLSAYNFNPSATTWDYSCKYLKKVVTSKGTFCLLFEDVVDLKDKSFTISYAPQSNEWVFFHDFIPDFYFHTRDKLFNLKQDGIVYHYEHNAGKYGQYHNQSFTAEPETKPFFIDVVFKSDTEFMLYALNWVTTVKTDTPDYSSKESEWNTLTHISIWNSTQHTGRIPLNTVQEFADLQYQRNRQTQGVWSFNDFRDVVKEKGITFLKDLFDNYALDITAVGPKDWYEKEFIQDKYAIVRLEFDNSQQKQLILHEVSGDAKKANR